MVSLGLLYNLYLLWPHSIAFGPECNGSIQGCGSASLCTDLDPDPAFNFNTDPDPACVDPDPDPAFHQSDGNLRTLD